ncbi:hypothetical protein [Corynebacterium pilosum]|uniref:Uncharacterized protein n=1 Tax=Corynebacterium pilosum TaxID=35756 RepID=A0A376CQX8_9CORY|nr:hypothetical protein [Corynebacterium pilosum]STC70617.1 Uncharacterised protein [Corynebacterium pilosum]
MSSDNLALVSLDPWRSYKGAFEVGGDPNKVRSTSDNWENYANAIGAVIEALSSADVSFYRGDGGYLFRKLIHVFYPKHFKVVESAHRRVAGIVDNYATDLITARHELSTLSDEAHAQWKSAIQWEDDGLDLAKRHNWAINNGDPDTARRYRADYDIALRKNHRAAAGFENTLAEADKVVEWLRQRVAFHVRAVNEVPISYADTDAGARNFAEELPDDYQGSVPQELDVEVDALAEFRTTLMEIAGSARAARGDLAALAGYDDRSGGNLYGVTEEFRALWDNETALLAQKLEFTGGLCRYWAKEIRYGDQSMGVQLVSSMEDAGATESMIALSVFATEFYYSMARDVLETSLESDELATRIAGQVGLGGLNLLATPAATVMGVYTDVKTGVDRDISLMSAGAGAAASFGLGRGAKVAQAGARGVKNAAARGAVKHGSEATATTVSDIADVKGHTAEKLEEGRYGGGLKNVAP